MVEQPTTMPALVLHAIGDIRYEQLPLPVPQQDELLVRIAAAGVCGSDIPRIYQHGTYSFPLVPGHELAGIVETDYSSSTMAGKRVTIKPLIPCRHCAYCQIGAFGQCTNYDYLGSRRNGGFAGYVTAPVENLVVVPDSLSLSEAALTEPAAVALHAVRQGGIEPGDVVAILGTGPIGMLLAQWAWYWGASRVLLVDIDQQKLDFAANLGLGEPFNSANGDPMSWVIANSHGNRGADLVLEAAGAPVTLAQAIQMARPLGRIVLMGNPASDVRLPQAVVSQILRKQLTIRGTWNSTFTELPVNEWQLVLTATAAGRIKLKPLISHTVPLAQGISVLEMMRDRSAFFNRVILTN